MSSCVENREFIISDYGSSFGTRKFSTTTPSGSALSVPVHKLKLKTQTFYWTTMKSGFAKIQTYNKHTHRHERKWNEMKACRRNNNLDIRYAVRAIPVFLSCTRVYWYSRFNLNLCSLICSVGTYVYIYVLVHAKIHMSTHAYIHSYAYTQVTYRDMYTYEGIDIYSMFKNIFPSYI